MFKYYLMPDCNSKCPLWCYPIHHKWIPRFLFVSYATSIVDADAEFKKEFPEYTRSISTVKGELDLCDLFSHEFTSFHDWEETTQAIHHYH